VIATEVGAAKRPKKRRGIFKDEGPKPIFAHFGHFFDPVRTRQPYWEDAVAGHHAASCAHLINLSAKERRPGLSFFQSSPGLQFQETARRE